MNNVSTINLPVSTFGNVDDILVNASGSAGRIKKVDFLGAMAVIDDTSTTGNTVTWSASKINSVIGDINTILASVTGGIE